MVWSTISDSTLACINYVLNKVVGVVRWASQCVMVRGAW